MPKYIGSFKILIKNNIIYNFELAAQYHVCPSFHIPLLKPVVPNLLDEALLDTTPPPRVTVKGAPVYAVRQVLDSRRIRGTFQYIVDWESYKPKERS